MSKVKDSEWLITSRLGILHIERGVHVSKFFWKRGFAPYNVLAFSTAKAAKKFISEWKKEIELPAFIFIEKASTVRKNNYRHLGVI